MSRGINYVVEDRGYATPCWIWQGGTSGDGYGRVRADGTIRPAHRVAYETSIGPVPDGLQLDHLCFVPSCVNPEHLEPVTSLENRRRARSVRLTTATAAEIKRTCMERAAQNGGRVPDGAYDELAVTYGVRKGTIRAIRRDLIWRDV